VKVSCGKAEDMSKTESLKYCNSVDIAVAEAQQPTLWTLFCKNAQ